jgi:hypothetical protein
MTLDHIVATVAFDITVATVPWDYTVATMTLDDIVTFNTSVAFVIPLVALLMSSPVMWHKDPLWNFSVLQRLHFSNLFKNTRVVQKGLGLLATLYDTWQLGVCQHSCRRWQQQQPSAVSCSKFISEFSHTCQWTCHGMELSQAMLDHQRRAVCGKAAPGHSAVFRWVVAFNSGIKSMEKGVSPGRPPTACMLAMVQHVSKKIMEDRHVTFTAASSRVFIRKSSNATKTNGHKMCWCCMTIPGPIPAVRQQTLVSLRFSVLPHLPYSPDLAPSDYALFDKMKDPLHGRRFPSDDDLQSDVCKLVHTIPKD